jgi:23S rRNA (cytosine1962-C5)-methyltransferase
MNKLILKPGREKSLKRATRGILGARSRNSQARRKRATRSMWLARMVSSWPLPLAIRTRKSSRECGIGSGVASTLHSSAAASSAPLRCAASCCPHPMRCRLVHAESDGLPGVVIDRYGDVVVMQLSSAGAMRWREAIAGCDRCGRRARKRYSSARTPTCSRSKGCSRRSGLLRGEPPPVRVLVSESGAAFEVEFRTGHKSGFYLDQRDNRLRVRQIAKDREVLDCFCYTGGFTVERARRRRGESDRHRQLGTIARAARRNVALNGQPEPECIEGDVFQLLRKLRDHARSFDLIVLDPPKFCPDPRARGESVTCLQGHQPARIQAAEALGDCCFTFSCSGGVSRDLFQKSFAGAALDAGVNAQIVDQLKRGRRSPGGAQLSLKAST